MLCRFPKEVWQPDFWCFLDGAQVNISVRQQKNAETAKMLMKIAVSLYRYTDFHAETLPVGRS